MASVVFHSLKQNSIGQTVNESEPKNTYLKVPGMK